MKQKIHYENDSFYLKSHIRLLSDGLKLNIDSFIFYEKTLEDIQFIEQTIGQLYNSLEENPHLIRRADHLVTIRDTKKQFIAYLESLTRNGNPFSEDLKKTFPKLRRAVANHTRDILTIETQLKKSGPLKNRGKHISENEMSFLLTPFIDDDQEE